MTLGNLGPVTAQVARRVHLSIMVRNVGEIHGVQPEQIVNYGKTRHIAHARHHFMSEAHAAGYSYKDIAEFLGFDHSSVTYGVRAHRQRADAEERAWNNAQP